MENKSKTIQSWRGQTVRVKREYIEIKQELDEYESTFDDEGNVVIAVYSEPYYYINTHNGMNSVLWNEDLLNATFYVQYDCYGVDLYRVREDINISELPEPTHQIIIRETMYPYLWDAKYFEVITEKVTKEWVVDEEYK
jgi:hypothetical protein